MGARSSVSGRKTPFRLLEVTAGRAEDGQRGFAPRLLRELLEFGDVADERERPDVSRRRFDPLPEPIHHRFGVVTVEPHEEDVHLGSDLVERELEGGDDVIRT